ncbi:hypothetical protein Mal64_30060 [Pseudobythopirellula maris]|uniref:Uncharacterized protein n=1 Tax=Pseudobythopirellula maris TaxID=2527991 RepID=A0A5C5ZK93_9BACT|nr:hypothetical protein [Pseudobythopirellula maris]TWT87467.1 hypothetical protein Mal64_30060 [Pseudobythopirellula maris]
MLRQKTQRRLCRAIFFAGCLTPTLLIMGLAMAHQLTRGVALDRLAARLGVRLGCERLETPEPGSYLLTGVAILSAETDHEVARCDRLLATRRNGEWRLSTGVVSIGSAGSGETRAVLARLTEERLDVGLFAEATRVRVYDDEPTGDPALELEHCQFELRENATTAPALASSESTSSSVALAAPETTGLRMSLTAAGGFHLSVERNRQLSPPATRLTLVTGTVGVPARLLAGCAPAAANLGHDARFHGKLEATLPSGAHGEAWGELTGGFGEVSAQRLLPGGLGADWQSASLHFDQLAWRGERLQRAWGRLDARNGMLDKGLVYGAYQHLKCQPTSTLVTEWDATPDESRVAFDRVALEFDLDAMGLVLVGHCGDRGASGAIAHALVSRGEAALITQPIERPLPLASVVHALSPPSQEMLPATPVAGEIARRLPLGERGEERRLWR